MLHSAIWPKDFDLKDKRVAVIGVGSTAVQIVPAIQPSALLRSCWNLGADSFSF